MKVSSNILNKKCSPLSRHASLSYMEITPFDHSVRCHLQRGPPCELKPQGRSLLAERTIENHHHVYRIQGILLLPEEHRTQCVGISITSAGLTRICIPGGSYLPHGRCIKHVYSSVLKGCFATPSRKWLAYPLHWTNRETNPSPHHEL